MAMRWLHFRVDEQLHARARQAATADRRTLSNWLALTIERALEETPGEMGGNDKHRETAA
jgi:hypothetical protein